MLSKPTIFIMERIMSAEGHKYCSPRKMLDMITTVEPSLRLLKLILCLPKRLKDRKVINLIAVNWLVRCLTATIRAPPTEAGVEVENRHPGAEVENGHPVKAAQE
ncbi:unnamed protein product [Malus baccata var. baccata]